MAKKMEGRKTVQWNVEFHLKTAEELRLVQLGIQPDQHARYLQVRLNLQEHRPIDLVK